MRVTFFPSSPQRESLRRYVHPLTFLKCDNCGTLNSRPFQEGDYVFKSVEEKCPSCGSVGMSIISIHIEERPKLSK